MLAFSWAVDPGGQRLAVGGFDDSVLVYEISTARELTRFVAAPGWVPPLKKARAELLTTSMTQGSAPSIVYLLERSIG